MRRACIFLFLFFSACSAIIPESKLTILDGNDIFKISTYEKPLVSILKDAAVSLNPQDKIYLNGFPISNALPNLNGDNNIIQVQRTKSIIFSNSGNKSKILTSSMNIGQFFLEKGIELNQSDLIYPSLTTSITSGMEIIYRPARSISLKNGNKNFVLKTSQTSIGRILSSAGFPLEGLNFSSPSEADNFSGDGHISIFESKEKIVLSENVIPNKSKYEYSNELTPGEKQFLITGHSGLQLTRSRIKIENGQEVGTVTEKEFLFSNPLDNLIKVGSNGASGVIKTPEGEFQYYQALQMYTTSYSPCRSGVKTCLSGTKSGRPLMYGIVAVLPSLYNQLAGTQVYIPGYGIGIIADIGGGFPDGRPWIDLGYSDNDYQEWSGYHWVYFLSSMQPN